MEYHCVHIARPSYGSNGTLVQLKTGEEVLLENSEEEVVEEMNKFDIETPR
jgi:hypothetical protein